MSILEIKSYDEKHNSKAKKHTILQWKIQSLLLMNIPMNLLQHLIIPVGSYLLIFSININILRTSIFGFSNNKNIEK